MSNLWYLVIHLLCLITPCFSSFHHRRPPVACKTWVTPKRPFPASVGSFKTISKAEGLWIWPMGYEDMIAGPKRIIFSVYSPGNMRVKDVKSYTQTIDIYNYHVYIYIYPDYITNTCSMPKVICLFNRRVLVQNSYVPLALGQVNE